MAAAAAVAAAAAAGLGGALALPGEFQTVVSSAMHNARSAFVSSPRLASPLKVQCSCSTPAPPVLERTQFIAME